MVASVELKICHRAQVVLLVYFILLYGHPGVRENKSVV